MAFAEQLDQLAQTPIRGQPEMESRTGQLAEEASKVEQDLRTVEKDCKHESTCEKIKLIADECLKLRSTLQSLDAAIQYDPTQYTQAFNQDLEEISGELLEIFAEIKECTKTLALADCNPSSVTWFFKRGRVGNLVKHLETLAGTLVVMGLVLQHGKEYGTHTSDRLAESSPHTMHEDRVILQALFANNKKAIIEMQNLTRAYNTNSKHTLERKPSKAGDHHRKLSEATGVDVSEIPDVLPPPQESTKGSDHPELPANLRRTFSRRAPRLGVHMSLLDLSANEAPAYLKQKWIHQARQIGHSERRGLTALPELSRISEVDTTAGSTTNLHSATLDHLEHKIGPIQESPLAHTPARMPDVPFNTPDDTSAPKSGTVAPTQVSASRHAIAGRIRRVVNKLSFSNLRSPSNRPKQPSVDSGKTIEAANDEAEKPSLMNESNETYAGRQKKPMIELLMDRMRGSPSR